ncbi:MAG: glycosyltransferase family A protein [Cyanobacteria bacterium J06638_22]
MMQSKSPLVSVVIPAYNAENFIEKTLESFLAQTHQNLEILVIDDGSSDRTAEIAQTYSERDSRITLIQQPNGGVAAARNSGIQQAKGEFIAPVDADDVWHPEAVALMVQRFDTASEETGVVYGWSLDINESGKVIGGFHAATIEGLVLKTLLCHNFLGNASSTLIRRSCFDHVGGYDEQLKAQNAQGCEDWDLYLRLAEHYTFAVVPKFLVGYRKLSAGMSADSYKMARSQRLMLDKVRESHPEIPGMLHRLSRSSFYLYLAHQSHINRKSGDTLHWLWQAVLVDPVTPFCRLGFYQLAIINAIRCIWVMVHPHHQPLSIAYQPTTTRRSSRLSQPAVAKDGLVHRVQVKLKLWVGSLLHQSLLRI